MSNNEYQGIRHDREIVRKLMRILPSESQLISTIHENLLTMSVVHTKNMSSFHICILTPDCSLSDNLQQDLLELGTRLIREKQTFILSYCSNVPTQTNFVHNIQLRNPHFQYSPYLAFMNKNDDLIVTGIQKKIWSEKSIPSPINKQILSINLPEPGYITMKFITNEESDVIGAEFPDISMQKGSLYIPTSFFTQQILTTLKINGFPIKIMSYQQLKKTSFFSLVIYQSYEEIKMILDCFSEIYCKKQTLI